MTGEEVQRQLETVDRDLEQAVDRLIRTPSRIAEVQEELTKSTRILKAIHRSRPFLKSSEALLSALRVIQSRAERLHFLLEGAVTFYCGAISNARLETGAYTPNGEPPAGLTCGYLRFEA